jgi:hypothetical protein
MSGSLRFVPALRATLGRRAAALGLAGALVIAPAAAATAATSATAVAHPKVLALIPFGATGPHAVAVSPLTDEAYVINSALNAHSCPMSVWVINGRTHKVTAKINPPTRGTCPELFDVVVSPVTGDAYLLEVGVVGNIARSTVVAISGKTNKVIKTFDLSGALGNFLVSPKTGDVYVDDISPVGKPKLTVINGRTNKVSAAVRLPAKPSGTDAISPVTGDIYAATGDTVTVINGKTNKVTASVPLGSSGVAGNLRDAMDVAVSPVTGEAYVYGQDQHQPRYSYMGEFLAVISGKTNKVIETWTGTDGATTTLGAPVISPKTGDVYYADIKDNEVVIRSGTTNAVIGTVTGFPDSGYGPTPLTVSPVTGDLYVENFGDFSLWVVGGTTGKITGSVKVVVHGHPEVGLGAISPRTGDVYVINYAPAHNAVAVVAG